MSGVCVFFCVWWKQPCQGKGKKDWKFPSLIEREGNRTGKTSVTALTQKARKGEREASATGESTRMDKSAASTKPGATTWSGLFV